MNVHKVTLWPGKGIEFWRLIPTFLNSGVSNNKIGPEGPPSVVAARRSGLQERLFVHGCTYIAERMMRESDAAATPIQPIRIFK